MYSILEPEHSREGSRSYSFMRVHMTETRGTVFNFSCCSLWYFTYSGQIWRSSEQGEDSRVPRCPRKKVCGDNEKSGAGF